MVLDTIFRTLKSIAPNVRGTTIMFIKLYVQN